MVEHLLCKQGAVGSIPTVSILCEWVLILPRGLSGASRSLEGAHVPLHDRFAVRRRSPEGIEPEGVLFDR